MSILWFPDAKEHYYKGRFYTKEWYALMQDMELDFKKIPLSARYIARFCFFLIIDSDKKIFKLKAIKMYNKLKMIMASGSILGYFLQVVPITIFVGIVYCVIRLIFIKKKDDHILWGKEIFPLAVGLSIC
jgi:hypothetical protein